ncbi:protein-L-isoaspartate(D-aspartate) O-methyltransferase [Polaromonas sp. OV174]|uniref:protein-L-isoaspartate(D-aspartate) O-methyltransferase n=1 Tax=Polaromonas sp. OV174 TaxID=1855300 RepID=UPI0008E187F4|nr:protein-L-isoaspartate(D-aspartate) O-methyltransferase [Polaromonas sp. OV174]SFC54827.1 protein-L-isoaspartate(D-aspartate) O-methyltransferase [Polaromonas sp. OV174]
MKSPLKPPFNPTAKTPTVTERPSFPVRLKPDTGVPSATKLVAASAYPERAVAINSLRNALPASAPGGVGPDSQALRARMLQKLAAQGVSDDHVLAAMGAVERHRFVDTALVNQAYEDTSLPIGLGQTISKPNVVARMLELLRQGCTGKLGRVLEIGTGCGYQAAVLSHLATEVYSIERLRGLHDKARENLRPLRLPNVHLLFGDGMIGFPKGAPYAAIIAAAGGEAIPAAWIEQLAVGGRLVAPLQTSNGAQALVLIEKTRLGVKQTLLEAVHFVPLKSGTS